MAKVTGNNQNGLVKTNLSMKKVEPLMDVERLKNTYLFGVHVTDASDGQELPEEAYQKFLDDAISFMEHFLDISIAPVRGFQEFIDYRRNEYVDFGYMELSNYPVQNIQAIDLVYYRDNDNTPIVAQNIPNNWIRLDNHSGVIRLMPSTRFPAPLQVDGGTAFYPELLGAAIIPHAWRITYDYGFGSGEVPVLLNTAIGMMASIMTLIPAGHLILGAGIASNSISLDGLSQSINTTQSAENSGFSATMGDYKKLLFGATKDDPFAILKILKNYYKGADIRIL